MYIYIYIYIWGCVDARPARSGLDRRPWPGAPPALTANLRTKVLDFRGFDSSIILILRGGILMSIGNFPESLSQAIF